ncbi:deoxypentalenic acid 11-beta-hydroxylase [Seminavis robusta]|uniref:Deoxypentalenic acid 11-beta-hydroxylase n=1 Tax=Seminavis robusta TaxID=568900 RepID=A0A9N8DLG0_9STRA|nr:deoxypentalenic acid 11-beta-hydroxylase [Seminavis robusta]|eukprot:Sro224_g091530.1 deoxypentalenic acid 11-beta-hydroxylase (330) ;mRNA; f:13525-14615
MLSKEQLNYLDKDGYLVVEDLLDPEKDLEPIIDELSQVADGLAHDLVARGELSSIYEDLPFEKRLARIIAETGQSHSQHFDFSLPKGQVGAHAPMYLGNALFQLITNSQLLDCVQDVIGPEIYSNPVQHARLKPPESVVPKKAVGMSVLVGETPWHQDNAVLTEDADETNVLTVWIPLVDTTERNGCLIVVPGSHRMDSSLAQHCHSGHGVLRIPDSVIEPHRDEVIPVPVKRGGVLIFHRRLWHASLPNLTEELRTSLDLRYQPLGEPTGRDMFPGFVVRSSNPEQRTLQSRDDWEKLWKDTQKRMASKDYVEQPFDRWQSSDHPLCA